MQEENFEGTQLLTQTDDLARSLFITKLAKVAADLQRNTTQQAGAKSGLVTQPTAAPSQSTNRRTRGGKSKR